MRYCVKCLNVDTRPNTVFSEDGLCPPCTSYIPTINYQERKKEILEVIKTKKRNSRSEYDSILGVSGGKDSLRQAIFLKEEMGLNPLLVSMNYPFEQLSLNGVKNLTNISKKGFDVISISLGTRTWKKAMREAFLKYGNWARATEHALFASVPKIAIAKGINIIWWGENPAILDGDLAVSGKERWDGNNLRNSNTLRGGKIDWLIQAGISKSELNFYQFPAENEFNKADIQVIFMDYLLEDFSYLTNSLFSCAHGLSTQKINITTNSDFYGTSMLDEDFINVNMLLRYLKFGFGRASDIVNVEIRSGRMSREEGIKIVKNTDHVYSQKVVNEFCLFIGISEDEFWNVCRQFSNPNLFRWHGNDFSSKFEIG